MKKIVVVMGGPSTEAEVSRRSGKAICMPCWRRDIRQRHWSWIHLISHSR